MELYMYMKKFLIMMLIAGTSASYVDNFLHPVNIFYFESSSSEAVLKEQLVEESTNMTCGKLNIDEACIIIKSNVDYGIKFLYQSMECEKCALLETEALKPHESEKVILRFASLGTVWKVIDKKNESICSLKNDYFGENSWYHLYVNSTGCTLKCDKEPEYIYYPIFIVIGIYITLATLWTLGNYLKRKEVFSNMCHHNSLDDLAAASTSVEDTRQKAPQKRLRSLDTVRGIAISVTIFVNYGGRSYTFIDHSIWNGLTVADLVFPWFIWMMGMSMALSVRSQLRKAVSRKKIFLRIVKRSVILFALGIMLNGQKIDLHKLRIPGVLQRFSISYFIVATVHLFYASAEDNIQISPLRDIVPYVGEWLIMLMFLIAHILLTFLVAAPECPLGYLGPGGLHDGGKFSLCTGGAAGYIDRKSLGDCHIYQHPTFSDIYHTTLPYDPEGILGYLTSFFLVYLGLQAGKILICYKETKPRVLRWIAWAFVTGLIAAILCKCSKNDGYIPVNKNLWSVSFILATGSMAFTLISLCYCMSDVQNWWSGAPFYYAGMNSIMLYVGHAITRNMFPWRWQVEQTYFSELFLALWGTTLWVLISVWMFYKNVFLAV